MPRNTDRPHKEVIILNIRLTDKQTGQDFMAWYEKKITSTWKKHTILVYEKLRERLAKQEMLTPPGHLVSTLESRRPWMTTVYDIICATMRVHHLFRIL